VIPENYEYRKALLISNNIALWDVLQFCERKGSLDMHITNPIPNQLVELLQENQSITKIIFNGKESHRLFLKYFGQIPDMNLQIVPSTSPANTIKFEFKLDSWRRVLL
jgi:hypoxanthine-DNA glycosylase